MARVLVGLSGGVDSAVAALLLVRAGHAVEGVFIRSWEDDGACPAREDLVAAAAAAEAVGIPLEAVDFTAQYRERVFAEFLREHRAGRTPNPDVLCNAQIKFRAFLEYALDRGARAIATGHYARVRSRNGRWELLRGVDRDKDQSYFLHRLTQAQLARVFFPVGEMEKRAVRAMARAAGLPNHDRPDSTGICFVGERPYARFLARYLPPAPGPILDPEGRTLGEHRGLHFYTVGQRKGLGLGGRRGAGSEPWYVAHKDLARNALIVVQGRRHPLLERRALAATQAHWISGAPPCTAERYTAKTRYRQPDAACRVVCAEADHLELCFDEPQRAIAPGQAAVLYDGEVCLGGAVIA